MEEIHCAQIHCEIENVEEEGIIMKENCTKEITYNELEIEKKYAADMECKN